MFARGGESTLLATDGLMPTISRFFGITIAMFFDDHGSRTFMHAMPKVKPRSGLTISK